MRIAVTGASGVFGRGIAARLRSEGHDVVGMARHRPRNWFPDSDFVEGDIRDAASVQRALAGTDVVAHCAWMVACSPDEQLTRDTNIGGTENVLAAMARAGTRRIVFASSVFTYGGRSADQPAVNEDSVLTPAPAHFYGFHKAHVERLLSESEQEWVSIRPGLVLGRAVDNMLLRLLGSPAFPNVERSADRPLQVVHPDDVHRCFVNAVLGHQTGALNLAAPGEVSVRDITSRLGRPLFPAPKSVIQAGLGFLYQRELVEASPAEFELLLSLPIMNTERLTADWGYTPAWTASECIDDFALAVRGRVSLGKHVMTLPWRMPFIQDMPAIDEAPADGVLLQQAGPVGFNGEFDSVVDPRFPTFVATNLSEALPGPFSPASASATVRGLRAGGVSVADRLRLRGVVGREVAARSIGTFAHRLYGGVTSTYFMTTSMPGTNPDGLIDQFFGRELGDAPVFGDERPPAAAAGIGRRVWDFVNVGLVGVGLLSASSAESREYVEDVNRLERLLPDDLASLDDNRLESLILLSRDLLVHGWMLASWAALLCSATATAADRLGGGTPTAGRDVASGRALASINRLAGLARTDPTVVEAMSDLDDPVTTLRDQVPAFYEEVTAELRIVGHRGPAECELRSTTYGDEPAQFIRVIAKTLDRPLIHAVAPRHHLTWTPRHLVTRLAGRQIRDRESRRDKVVRSTAILRRLLREFGHRLVQQGVLDQIDDIFFLQVDELDALPADPRALVKRRRSEMERLRDVHPPSVFSGTWSTKTDVSPLSPGESLSGLGVSGGRATGRVRIVNQDTIDDLEPGEILVAEVTDVGYTPAFAYAGAVITNLGGPMSHAAIVAREFGVTCVVSAANAHRRLPDGALIDVDGSSGEITVLELAADEATRNTR